MSAKNRFVFGEHAVPNNLAARVSPRMSSVARIRKSVIKTLGPSSSSCAPVPRPEGTSSTIHNANVRAAEYHEDKVKRAKNMPSSVRKEHVSRHTSLQRAYMIACTSSNTTVHPDPLVLESLEGNLLTIDVMLYEEEDFNAVIRMLVNSKVVRRELEGIVVSCGEIRGASSQMRRIGWEASDLPRSVLVGGPQSPTKVKQRGTKGRCKELIRAISKCLQKCENLTHLEFCGINLTPLELKILASGLEGNISLCSLIMRRVLLGQEGGATILPAISTTQAEILVLSHCGLTDSARGALTHIVKSACCRRDELTWALSLRGKNTQIPTSNTAPGAIPTAGVLCMDLSNNKLGDDFATSLSHSLIHDGWLLGLNLSNNKIGMSGATALVEMLVTNRYLAAIEVNGNPCLRNPKGKKGLEMMESMLNRRSVTSNHDGLWDGVIDLVEEWRGEGSHSFFEVGEEEEEEEEEEVGEGGDDSFVYKVALEDGDVMSPSGLKFAEGFVDDNDNDEAGEEGEERVEEIEEAEAEVQEEEEEEEKKKKEDEAGEVKSKKKKKKKKKKVTDGKRKSTKAKLNLTMEVPGLPPTPKVKLTSNQRKAAARVAQGRVSPPAAPPMYLKMSSQEFEKALFGPASKAKGISALFKEGVLPSTPKRKKKKGTTLKKKSTGGKKNKDEAEGTTDYLLNGRNEEGDGSILSSPISTSALTQISAIESLRSTLGSGTEEEDKIILRKLDVMIQTMTKDLTGLEKKVGKGKAKKRGKRGGMLKGEEKAELVDEITIQIASRLKQIWK